MMTSIRHEMKERNRLTVRGCQHPTQSEVSEYCPDLLECNKFALLIELPIRLTSISVVADIGHAMVSREDKSCPVILIEVIKEPFCLAHY